MAENKSCEHNWVHGGVKYHEKTYHLSGTSARQRDYYDWYYCSKCAESKYVPLSCSDTTYDAVKFNATPAHAGAFR